MDKFTWAIKATLQPANIKTFLVAFTAAFVFLLLHPFFGTELRVDVDASDQGVAQVFFASHRGGFAETASVKASVNRGPNELTFAAPLYQRTIRLDPFDRPGRFSIRRITVHTAWNVIPVGSETVEAHHQIARLNAVGGGVDIQTQALADDPQLLVRLPIFQILGQRFANILLVSFLVALGALGLGNSNLMVERAAAWLKREATLNRAALMAFPWLLMIAFLCNFYALSTFALSVDDEYAALRIFPEVWISQGRWTVYLIEKFILPQPTMPFLPNALFCVFITISYVLIARAHALTMNWKVYLLFPLFCAFPVWGYIAEFYANLPSASFGLMLTSLAAYGFYRTITSAEPGRSATKMFGISIVVQGLLLATAIAAYQSLLFLFACLGLGIILTRFMTEGGTPIRMIIRHLTLLLAMLVAGFVMYSLVQQSLLLALNLKIEYIDGFIRPGELLTNPIRVLAITLSQVGKLYFGDATLYGTSLSAFGFIIFLAFTSVLMKPLPAELWAARATALILTVTLMLLPFAMNVLAGGIMPLRTLLGVPYVLWLLGLLALMNTAHILRAAGALACLMGSFQVLYLSALYGASTELTQNHDRMLANNIYQRIATTNTSFDPTEIHKVDFFGSKQFDADVYPTVETTTTHYSLFAWDNGNPHRIIAFMKLLGYKNLVPISPEQRLKFVPIYNRMPAWPENGSVRVVDGVTLVKLGKVPSSFHKSETR